MTARRKTPRAPRLRRARPLLLVAAGVSLSGIAGCGDNGGGVINNIFCPPSMTCVDMSAATETDMAPSPDGGPRRP
jgi:hypothetical protein